MDNDEILREKNDESLYKFTTLLITILKSFMPYSLKCMLCTYSSNSSAQLKLIIRREFISLSLHINIKQTMRRIEKLFE